MLVLQLGQTTLSLSLNACANEMYGFGGQRPPRNEDGDMQVYMQCESVAPAAGRKPGS